MQRKNEKMKKTVESKEKNAVRKNKGKKKQRKPMTSKST